MYAALKLFNHREARSSYWEDASPGNAKMAKNLVLIIIIAALNKKYASSIIEESARVAICAAIISALAGKHQSQSHHQIAAIVCVSVGLAMPSNGPTVKKMKFMSINQCAPIERIYAGVRKREAGP